MGNATLNEPAVLLEAAKRRMERWFLSQELREHMQVGPEVCERPVRTGPYIAISREAGAGGARIARLVGQQLDWDVLDKELLDFMTQLYRMPRDMLELVDETKASWLRDVLGCRFESRLVRQDDYAVRLERLLFLAAMHGRVVFVGRGAHRVLARERGLAVRIVASDEYRIQQIMRGRNLTRQEARKLMLELDAGRRQFSRRYFGTDIDDPHSFDLVMNVENIMPETAMRHIVEAFRTLRAEAIL